MIRLYRAPYSTNVERVALALALKGLEVESVEISYDDRSPVERVSGQGLVPVIEDGGLVVVDSTEILRYLDREYPDPPLFPEEPRLRAEVDVFLEWFNEVWKGPPNRIAEELERERPDRELIASLSARMDGWLDRFDALLADRSYLFGDGLTAADLAAFPFLKYALAREEEDDELFHLVVDEHQSVEGRPGLEAWIRRIDALPRV